MAQTFNVDGKSHIPWFNHFIYLMEKSMKNTLGSEIKQETLKMLILPLSILICRVIVLSIVSILVSRIFTLESTIPRRISIDKGRIIAWRGEKLIFIPKWRILKWIRIKRKFRFLYRTGTILSVSRDALGRPLQYKLRRFILFTNIKITTYLYHDRFMTYLY